MNYEEMKNRIYELLNAEPVVRRDKHNEPLPEDSKKFLEWIEEIKTFLKENDVPPDLQNILAPVY